MDALSLGSLSLAGGSVRLSGTTSKLDTDAIIQAAYQAKRLPAVRLERKIALNEAKDLALGELRGLLERLQGAVAGLRNPPGFLGARENLFETKQTFLTAAPGVAAGELLGVVADSSARTGTFDIEIIEVATAAKLAAAPVAAGQSLAAAWNGGTGFAGTIEIGLAGGSKAAIAVDGAAGLATLRDAINAASATSGVSASIVKVSASDERLVLTAAETGRPIELDDGGSGITALLGLQELQAARPAVLRLDGLEIERSGNQIADLIDGITINLYGAAPGSRITVAVEPDLRAIKGAISAFVDAYNGFRAFLDRNSVVDREGRVGESAILFGNRNLRTIAQTLGEELGRSVGGLPPDAVSTLRQIGITLGAGNRLQIDAAALDRNLSGNLDAVRRVLEFQTTASSPEVRVLARSNALAANAFTLEITDADADGIPESATFDGIAAEISGRSIRGAAGTPYEGLVIAWVGTGSTSIDVTATQGIADRLFGAIERTLDRINGPLAREGRDLRATSERHREQIERIEARAEAARKLLIERFAAMEQALTLAGTMLSQLRAQTDAWTARNN